jgi:hypothetical protein
MPDVEFPEIDWSDTSQPFNVSELIPENEEGEGNEQE